MCGVLGVISKDSSYVEPIIATGLRRLSYRGYDSWGTAIQANNLINSKKGLGVIPNLMSLLPGTTGIGHVRWATHGKVSLANAHPHFNCLNTIAVVHNGIIENYVQTKRELEQEGHVFRSETDTEIIPHMIEKYLEKNYLDSDSKHFTFADAVRSAMNSLNGTYAILAMHSGIPNLIVATRNDSPLVIGTGPKGIFVSSDALSLAGNVDKIIYPENKDICIITKNVIIIWDADGKPVKRKEYTPMWTMEDALKGNYDYFMLKEIMEQPRAINSMLEKPEFKKQINALAELVKNADNIIFTACGTSRYAAVLGRYAISKLSGIMCEVVMASEFEYLTEAITPKTLVISVSQSGETADVIRGVKAAKAKGAKIASIINVPGTSLDRMSDLALYLFVGPEVGVAATKTFTAELVCLYALAFALNGKLDEGVRKMQDLPNIIEDNIFDNEFKLITLAKQISHQNDFYYIGRGANFALAGESALKLKEISYIHAEGMPAGELKHGTLSLISDGTPVAAICPNDLTIDATLNNLQEAKARGAYCIGFSDIFDEIYDVWIKLPVVDPIFYPLVSVIPTQLLAYYTAVEKGLSPDAPRSLAKCVTVL